MSPSILDLLRDNPAGLTLAALRSACPDADAALPTLVADGVVEPADLDGVAGYRLAAPKAPRPAKPPKRPDPALVALRKLLRLPEDADGAAIVEAAREALTSRPDWASTEIEDANRDARDLAVSRQMVGAAALQGVTWEKGPEGGYVARLPRAALPDGWTVTAMERQTPSSTLRVWKSSARAAWGWAYGTDEGPSAPDMDKAVACVEAVADVLGEVRRG